MSGSTPLFVVEGPPLSWLVIESTLVAAGYAGLGVLADRIRHGAIDRRRVGTTLVLGALVGFGYAAVGPRAVPNNELTRVPAMLGIVAALDRAVVVSGLVGHRSAIDGSSS